MNLRLECCSGPWALVAVHPMSPLFCLSLIRRRDVTKNKKPKGCCFRPTPAPAPAPGWNCDIILLLDVMINNTGKIQWSRKK